MLSDKCIFPTVPNSCCSALLLRYPDETYQCLHEFRVIEHIFSLIKRENVTKSPFLATLLLKSGNPCESYSLLIESSEFYVPKNMGIEP